jgi:hypothetical protein
MAKQAREVGRLLDFLFIEKVSLIHASSILARKGKLLHRLLAEAGRKPAPPGASRGLAGINWEYNALVCAKNPLPS